MRLVSGLWQESVQQLMQGTCQCASISGCGNKSKQTSSSPFIFNFWKGRPSNKLISVPFCSRSGEQERKLFPAAHLCRECGLKMWFGETAAPSLQLAGARGDSPAAFFLCPALCSPHPLVPGTISGTCC